MLDLLFGLAEWHTEAKLCMHTDSSLELLSRAMAYLGKQIRRFSKTTCSKFNTRELPHEAAAHGRRQHKAKTQPPPSATPSTSADSSAASSALPKTVNVSSTQKKFSLKTYKLHALGDYVQQICLFGTTDLYSTQMVSTRNSKCMVTTIILMLH